MFATNIIYLRVSDDVYGLSLLDSLILVDYHISHVILWNDYYTKFF